MKKAASSLGALLFLSVLLVPAVSHAVVGFHFEASGGAWFQGDPDGDIKFKGDSLKLKDDLGLEGKTLFVGRAKFEHPVPVLPNIALMVTPMTLEGKNTKSFQFGDVNFSGEVESRLRMNNYDVTLFWGVPILEAATLGKANIDFGLNVRLIDMEAEVSSGSSSSTTDKVFIPAPMVYLGAQVKPIDMFAVEADARGTAYGGHHYYSLIGRIKVKPFGPLFLSGGYRWEDIKIDDVEGVTADMTLQGPFVEAGVQF